MEIWNDFDIIHRGINQIEFAGCVGEYFHFLETHIMDRKTGYDIVHFNSSLEGKTLEFHIGTNEKMIKRLNLPTYKHKADFSYIEGKKYFDQKSKKIRNIPCLSLGMVNVGKILNSIISYWKEYGYTIKRVFVTRETGNTRSCIRHYKLEEE